MASLEPYLSVNSNGKLGDETLEENDEVRDELPSVPRRKSSVLKKQGRSASGKPLLEKSVSFTMPDEKKISNATDCLMFMQTGSELFKVRSNHRMYQRYFTLDEDLSSLRWRPTSKRPDKAKIPVNSIKEVRSGKTTDMFRELGREDVSDDCCFSIIHGDSFDSFDLVASSPDEANIWITGIRCLLESDQENSPDRREQIRDRWLIEQFKIADKHSRGRLNEKDILELMKTLNVQVPVAMIKQKFKEIIAACNMPYKNSLNKDEFLSMYKEITTRPEIYFLLARYASNNDSLTTDDLLIFLEAEQQMTRIGKDYCLEVIKRCEPSEEGRRKRCLGIDGFTKFLLEEDIFDPEHLNVCQDMSQPLSHYFIASSHNTYLLENQLSGKSSIDAYIKALQQNCRCVELDCWDGVNGEPVIYHGHTLTTKIVFRDAIEAINKHAFESSEYPLILSIENHCSVKQQKIMAQYMKDIFKENVITTPPGENEGQLQPPECLKRKILIKNKKLPTESSEEGEVSDEDEDKEDNSLVINGDYKSDKSLRTGSFKRGSVRENSPPKKTIKLAKELSDLVTYCKSVTFTDFQNATESQKYWELCSFSETVSRRLCTLYPEEFVAYNKQYLSRIYPAGKRVDSSNFNPLEFWTCGCQLVALNYQTPGLMMDLNTALFSQNGSCGYVLKPPVMREEISYFNPSSKDAIPGVTPQILQVKIISGQQFPKPKGSAAKGDVLDPYVAIEVFGIASDMAQERTRTVPHNGFNPVFDETFEFHVNLPELALVRFLVLDDDFIGDGFVGQYTLPFICIQQGYRHIRLQSTTGESLEPATLFIHVTITSQEGGGKARKGSLKRYRKGREYTSMKSLGVKAIDETFKYAIQPLRDGTDLRDNVQVALSNFKEACGMAPRSSLKQCLRMLASRLENVTEALSINLVMKDEFPHFEIEGSPPDMLKRALAALEQMVEESKHLTENCENVYERLTQSERAGLEWHEDLNNVCAKEGIKGRRLSKLQENFAWNIRVLRGQADLLTASKEECLEYMRQIQEAAISSGFVKSYGCSL